VKARWARPADAEAVHRLVEYYADRGLLLPRTPEEIRAHISRFLVLIERGELVGCVALESYGSDLAEIRSLAVAPERRGHGLGAELLRAALDAARRRKIARVFAVTHAPEIFGRQGFFATTRFALPEKLARDCRTCPKQRTCDLVAVIATLCSARSEFRAQSRDEKLSFVLSASSHPPEPWRRRAAKPVPVA